MPSRWEAEVAASRCWECGEPILPDEETVPATQAGWRTHAEGCRDGCAACGADLAEGRWPGDLCWGCFDPARARRP